MQPLVPLVFHNLPSLYPPSFRRNDFLYLYNENRDDEDINFELLDIWFVSLRKKDCDKCHI